MEIKEYTLKNDKLEVSFINLGATITKIIDLESGIDIIAGHNDLESYKDNLGYMNTVIGRNSGRITSFILDDTPFTLTKNIDNLYQLHGGYNGFHTKYFTAVPREKQITFVSASVDKEDGYHGDVIFWITYKLVDDELHLIYSAETNKKTILSFTQHAYFNLSGNLNNNILNHELYINADKYLKIDEDLLPYDKAEVKDTPLDFTKPKLIGDDINSEFDQIKFANGFDHPYLINKKNVVNHVATLKSLESGLILDVYSDQDCIVFYSGNFIDNAYNLKGNIIGKKHNALCLETQGIPNSINIKEFKDRNIFTKENPYHQYTMWKIHK